MNIPSEKKSFSPSSSEEISADSRISQFVFTMKISQEQRKIARHLYRLCLDENRRVDSIRLSELIDSLIELKPRGYRQILSGIARLVRIYISSRTAKVTSAHPLEISQLEAIKTALSRRGKEIVDLQVDVNPDLIAGTVVQFDGRLVDGSIRSRINELILKSH